MVKWSQRTDGLPVRCVREIILCFGYETIQKPRICRFIAGRAGQRLFWILREARALNARAHDILSGCLWVLAFLFLRGGDSPWMI